MKTLGFITTAIFFVFGCLLETVALIKDYAPPINLILALAGVGMLFGCMIMLMLTYIIDVIETKKP